MRSLRQARKKKHWTLKNLSDMSGITIANLSWIETGKVSPSILTRWRLEGIFGERIDFLQVPDLNIECLNPPADWNSTERQFRYLIKMMASLSDQERQAFIISATKHLKKISIN